MRCCVALLALVAVCSAWQPSDVIKYTGLSPPLRLYPGQVANTDPTIFGLDFPKGIYSIVAFGAEIVDEKNNSVPLTQVYLHHWIVFEGQRGNMGPCEDLSFAFGVGAESRRTNYSFPSPYGYITQTEAPFWGANVHILDERGIVDVKDEIECKCENVTGGGLMCCPDQIVYMDNGLWGYPANPSGEQLTYYLRYTIEYVKEVSNVKPLQIYVYDVSDCVVEYNISACDPSKDPQCISSMEQEWVLQNDQDLVTATGHSHIGAVDITLLHAPPGGEYSTVCLALPTYGNGTEPGNENGYVVAMGSCTFADPIKWSKGDRVKIISRYYSGHNGVIPKFQGAHAGVMGFFMLSAQVYDMTPPIVPPRGPHMMMS